MVLKEEYVSKSKDNEIKGMVKGNIEWVSEILKSENKKESCQTQLKEWENHHHWEW